MEGHFPVCPSYNGKNDFDGRYNRSRSVSSTYLSLPIQFSRNGGCRYRDGRLLDVVMAYLNARTPRELVLERHEPRFKQLEKFLNKVRVEVQTGPRGERSRIKTIRGLEPMAGDFEFLNSENRPTTVKVRISSSF